MCCTFFGQPKSLPPAIHCINQRMHIVGVSAAVPFSGEWPTVATWRTMQGRRRRTKKKDIEGQWRRGADNYKGKREAGRMIDREEKMVAYSKDNVATNAPWSPPHSSLGILQCGPNVLAHKRTGFLASNVAWYTTICCGLPPMPSNQSPEQQTHGLSATTFYRQSQMAKSRHRIYNRPADLGN